MENVYQNENITTNKERQNIYENINNRKKTTTYENHDDEEDIYHTRPSEVEAVQVQVALRRVEKRIEITRARKPKQRLLVVTMRTCMHLLIPKQMKKYGSES